MRSLPLMVEPSGHAFSTDTVTMQWLRLLAAFMLVAVEDPAGGWGVNAVRTQLPLQAGRRHWHGACMHISAAHQAAPYACASPAKPPPAGSPLTSHCALREPRVHQAHQLVLIGDADGGGA